MSNICKFLKIFYSCFEKAYMSLDYTLANHGDLRNTQAECQGCVAGPCAG